jgi:hypothetical protein
VASFADHNPHILIHRVVATSTAINDRNFELIESAALPAAKPEL